MAEAFLMHHIHTGGGGGGTDLVTWQNGSDDQIAAMVTADRAGSIDLRDYWSVGDERTVVLSAITEPSSGSGTGGTQPIQPITFVILHKGGDNDDYRFIVGTKECLVNSGFLHTNAAATSYMENNASRWIDIDFGQSLPSAFRAIFKKWNCIYNTKSGGTESYASETFALAAEKEVFGSNTWAKGESSLFQFDYYKTAANRIKIAGVNGEACDWWTRSIRNGVANFCMVTSAGESKNNNPSSGSNIPYFAPIGRI